jgi:Domain of unknown function (DUF4156)
VMLSSSACVTTQLTPAAQKVRVTTNVEVVRGCKFVGEVKASDRMNGGMFGQDAAEENTYRRLKNRAAQIGGNVVLLNRASTGYSGATARGEVYRCSEPNASQAPASR